MIERAGLATWRGATAADVSASDADLEVGDAILVLTAEGKRAVLAAHQADAERK